MLLQAGIYAVKILWEVFLHEKQEELRLRGVKTDREKDKDRFRKDYYEPLTAKRRCALTCLCGCVSADKAVLNLLSIWL